MLLVSGPGRFASFSIVTIIHELAKRGGLNRAKALSPGTANILPILLKATAGARSLVLGRSGSCATRFRLNGAASALSV